MGRPTGLLMTLAGVTSVAQKICIFIRAHIDAISRSTNITRRSSINRSSRDRLIGETSLEESMRALRIRSCVSSNLDRRNSSRPSKARLGKISSSSDSSPCASR